MSNITITKQAYEDLIDARDHAIAMRDIAAGAPVLNEAETLAYLEAVTPLAFWRNHRGMNQATLAAAVGISQPYLAQMETGRRVGTIGHYAGLARALHVRIEDLLSDAEPVPKGPAQTGAAVTIDKVKRPKKAPAISKATMVRQSGGFDKAPGKTNTLSRRRVAKAKKRRKRCQ